MMRRSLTCVVRPGAGASTFPPGRTRGITGTMSASTRDTTNRERKPRPPAPGTPVMLRLQPDQLADLDAWISAQPDAPSRPEAIRRILAEHLKGEPSK